LASVIGQLQSCANVYYQQCLWGFSVKHFIKAAVMAAVFAAAALSPAQAGVVVGTTDTNPNHSNSAPFGSLQASFIYQQVYDDSAFSGPLSISQLTFYNTMLPGGTPVPGAFQIFLQTTSQQVGGISVNFPDLSGATKVFDGAIPLLSNGRLDFSLSQSFDYDPSLGNLMLIVQDFNFRPSGSPMFLDSDTTNTVNSSRHYSGPNGPSGNLRTGLVTGFNDVQVPEPSTWAFMLFGLAGLGFLARRHKPGFPATAS
jgi:opacity protein-like surface antigen